MHMGNQHWNYQTTYLSFPSSVLVVILVVLSYFLLWIPVILYFLSNGKLLNLNSGNFHDLKKALRKLQEMILISSPLKKPNWSRDFLNRNEKWDTGSASFTVQMLFKWWVRPQWENEKIFIYKKIYIIIYIKNLSLAARLKQTEQTMKKINLIINNLY